MPDFDMDAVERINTAIRSVSIRFGPNALAIMAADGTVPLPQGESWHMALAVADEFAGLREEHVEDVRVMQALRRQRDEAEAERDSLRLVARSAATLLRATADRVSNGQTINPRLLRDAARDIDETTKPTR